MSDPTSNPSFAAFQQAFKGDLVTPSHPDYPGAIARWAANAVRRAAIVAFIKDPADAALALAYSKAHELSVAIRGGGHSAVGASSSEGGLVVDLSRYLSGVRIDEVARLAYVGGGALWETVDKTAIQYGLATPAGTVNHTGVGGLLLGGGIGWLSGAHGHVIDNLVQATVVVADGRILTANEEENCDLFWGIRGGGCNFGVCTEFVLKLHPQRRTVFAGVTIFAPTVLEKLVALTAEWWGDGTKPSDKEGMFQMYTRGPDGNPCIVVAFFYNGTFEEGRSNFKAFLNLEPVVDMTQEMPYEMLNTLQNDGVKHGQGQYMKGFYHIKPRLETTAKAHKRLCELAEGGYGAVMLLEYIPLGKIQSVPSGAMPFRRGPGSNGVFLMSWGGGGEVDHEEKAKYCRGGAGELGKMMMSGREASIGYGNYDGGGVAEEEDGVVVKNKAEGVFGENYGRLQEVKRKYDRGVMFDKWFVIKPL